MNQQVFDDFKGRSDLQRQIEKAIKFIHMLESKDESISCAILGSFAKGKPDRVSDIDLVCFVQEGKNSEVYDSLAEVESTFEVIHVFSQKISNQISFKKYIFGDMTSLEVILIDENFDFKLFAPYLIAFDKENSIHKYEASGSAPEHHEFQAFQFKDAGLMWEIFDCVKWLSRGEVKLTKDYLKKLVAQFD